MGSVDDPHPSARDLLKQEVAAEGTAQAERWGCRKDRTWPRRLAALHSVEETLRIPSRAQEGPRFQQERGIIVAGFSEQGLRPFGR